MKILNTEEFAKLSPGVLFSEYEPNILGDLRIKGETDYIGNNGWTSITDALINDIEVTTDFLSLESPDSSPVDLEVYTRDVYSPEQLFAVWEPEDLRKLISKLETAIEVTIV